MQPPQALANGASQGPNTQPTAGTIALHYVLSLTLLLTAERFRCYGASDEEMAPSSLQQTDGVPPCHNRMT